MAAASDMIRMKDVHPDDLSADFVFCNTGIRLLTEKRIRMIFCERLLLRKGPPSSTTWFHIFITASASAFVYSLIKIFIVLLPPVSDCPRSSCCRFKVPTNGAGIRISTLIYLFSNNGPGSVDFKVYKTLFYTFPVNNMSGLIPGINNRHTSHLPGQFLLEQFRILPVASKQRRAGQAVIVLRDMKHPFQH